MKVVPVAPLKMDMLVKTRVRGSRNPICEAATLGSAKTRRRVNGFTAIPWVVGETRKPKLTDPEDIEQLSEAEHVDVSFTAA